ncbi:MAG: archaellin/type IV pilin N-terminal domain-containing protein [Sulfolobales archaeon]
MIRKFKRSLEKSVSEIISAVLLTAITISLGLALFYLANLWVSESLSRNRTIEIADTARFDFQPGIEAFSKNSDGSITIYLRIIRVGALSVTGIRPFISVETTSMELREPNMIWFLGAGNIMISKSINISYSDPIDPQNLPSTPAIIKFNQCSSQYIFAGLNLSKVYIKSDTSWISLADVIKGITLNTCMIPLPPAPLGQILIRIDIPSNVASSSNYIVISGWIMIDNNLFNVFNVLYRNI